ncbi:hypothetical protein RclHR1_16820005 [Rhizophagus clarus]|uniref:Transposase domain-containing protein n=1 Tax=Rhizophagus clarus TaxID=94130 RepID=A0A2Z6QIG2_9GLOM|nr:hypothetical protein RclHR1_16820005 [Rhizophagus clarus]
MKKGGRKRIAANIIDEYNNPSSSTSEQTSTEFTIRKSREKAPTSQELVELIDSTISLAEPQDTTMSIDTHSDNDTYEEQKYIFLPRKKRAKPGTFRRITEVELVAEDSSYNVPAEYDTDDIYTSESSTQEDSPNDEDNDFSDNFENYSHPMFDIPDISDTPDISELPTDELIKGILIWIMKFRSSHNIPNTAIEELIQFIKIILKVCKNINYESFPNSLYMLRKKLGLFDRFTQFAACQKCHKLYKKEEIISKDNNTVMKCSHVEFPNSATKRLKQCRTPLGKKISLNNSISIVPELIYPVSSIQQQLSSMFKRPGFEELLRHWTRSNNFFRPDKADAHLGLMMNLDWFQPYEGTIYSTGVIYAVICNLPRDVRFKPENVLILGILPGPDEVKLHKVNHYLSPIITELESLWEGVNLNRTNECPNGKDI